MTAPKAPHILVISHPRSGTHLTMDTISNNFADYDRPFLNLDRLTQRAGDPLTLEAVRAQLDDAPHVVKSHMHSDVAAFFDHEPAHVEYVEALLAESRVVCVYRDGRDVMTSLYGFVRGFRAELREISFSEFIRMDNDIADGTYAGALSRVDYWKHHVRGWIDHPGVLRLSFEELRRDDSATLRRVAGFLGRELPTRMTSVIRTRPVDVHRTWGRWHERLYKRYMTYLRGVRSTATSFHQGVAGAWREQFSEEDLAWFESRAGDLMAKLGYG